MLFLSNSLLLRLKKKTSTCRDSRCWKRSKRYVTKKTSWRWETRLLKSRIFFWQPFFFPLLSHRIHLFIEIVSVCLRWQDLSDPRGEGQDHRRAVQEERAGCEDDGGHVRPKAQEWTIQVTTFRNIWFVQLLFQLVSSNKTSPWISRVQSFCFVYSLLNVSRDIIFDDSPVTRGCHCCIRPKSKPPSFCWVSERYLSCWINVSEHVYIVDTHKFIYVLMN